MGVAVGVAVGVFVGVAVGVAVGVFVGVAVGVAVGVFVGVAVGVAVGVFVGVAVGVFVGVGLGSASSFRMVPWPLASENAPLSTLNRFKLKVSSASNPRSPFTVTITCFVVSSAVNVAELLSPNIETTGAVIG